MQTPVQHAGKEPAKVVVRRAAQRSTDPGEAGRQRSSRRKIECDGAPGGKGESLKGRASGPAREAPRHFR